MLLATAPVRAVLATKEGLALGQGEGGMEANSTSTEGTDMDWNVRTDRSTGQQGSFAGRGVTGNKFTELTGEDVIPRGSHRGEGGVAGGLKASGQVLWVHTLTFPLFCVINPHNKVVLVCQTETPRNKATSSNVYA